MHASKYLIAVTVGVLLPFAGMIAYRSTQEIAFTPQEMIVFPLLFGGGISGLILGLNRYYLGQSFHQFNPGKGTLWTDLGWGVLLTLLYFGLMFVEWRLIAPSLPSDPETPSEIFDLIREMARSPLMLAFWLGPVVWIGVAFFEELARTFLLNCLWALWKDRAWEFAVLLFSAVLIGVLHFYQGWFGFVSIGIQSLVMGFYYYHFRRFWPLVISHALFDSIQIIQVVIMVEKF